MKKRVMETKLVTESNTGEPVYLMNGYCCCPKCEKSDWVLKQSCERSLVINGVEEKSSKDITFYRVECNSCGISTGKEFRKNWAIINAILLTKGE